MRRSLFGFSCAFSLLAFAVSCSNSTSNTSGGMGGGGGGGRPGAGGQPPSWTEVYSSVIVPKCGACHGSAGQIGVTEGKLDMSTQAMAYTNLVGVAAAGSECAAHGTRIVAGKPDDSVLYLKVSLDDPTPCGDKMPLGSPPLSQAEADLIEAWINAGAKND